MFKRPVKIVRLLARLNVGGPARHVVWLTAGEHPRKFHTVLVSGQLSPGEGDMSYFAREQGVKVKILRNFRREVGFSDLLAFFEILVLLFREKPDIIDTHTSKAGFLGRCAAMVYKVFGNWQVKCVHTYHGHTFRGYFGVFKSTLYLWLEKFFTFVITHRVVVISEQQKREFLDDFRFPSARLFRVIPLGIDLARGVVKKGFLRDRFSIPSRTVLVGHIGRLTSIKNQAFFIDAVEKLVQRNSDGELQALFIIVGDGEDRSMLEQRVEEKGLSRIILFTGFIREMERVYRDLDIMALTSRNEGTPLTILESLSHGNAIISTGVGGVPDLLKRRWRRKRGQWTLTESCHPRGVVVEEDSVELYSYKLEELIRDANLRRVYGKRGQEFIRRYHSKERLNRDMAEIYTSIVPDELKGDC